MKFYFILGGMLLAYLLIVELAKRGFYRWVVTSNKKPERHLGI